MGDSDTCYYCKERFGDDSRGIVRCNSCSKFFHGKCMGVDFRGFHLRKSYWRCALCIENNVPLLDTKEQIDNTLTNVLSLLEKISSQCLEMQKDISALTEDNKLLRTSRRELTVPHIKNRELIPRFWVASQQWSLNLLTPSNRTVELNRM